MTTLYAIVKPIVYYDHDGSEELDKVPFELYHFLMCERICDYSLGHEVLFFATLDDAKKNFRVQSISKINSGFFPSYGPSNKQDAILELDLKNDEITEITGIYKITKTAEVDGKYQPIWEDDLIDSSELTSGALAELNRLYQEKYQYKLDSVAVL